MYYRYCSGEIVACQLCFVFTLPVFSDGHPIAKKGAFDSAEMQCLTYGEAVDPCVRGSIVSSNSLRRIL